MTVVNRKVVKLDKLNNKNDDGYVDAPKEKLFEIVWEITKDVWAFMGEKDAEQGLQRNITNLIRRKG